MTRNELVIKINRQLRGLDSYIIRDDIEEAIDSALIETGWTLPVSGSFKEHWIIERTKRAVYDQLRSGSAHKFKVEGINLQHRFDHYNKLIRTMDSDFKAAIQDNPAEFAGVSTYEMFGTKIDAGFQYDKLGKDTTYDSDNSVVHTPSEETT